MKRYIKSEPQNFTNHSNIEISNLPPGNIKLHPTLLNLLKTSSQTKTPLCITKPHIKNNKMVLLKSNYICNDTTNNTYKKHMFIPPIGLSTEDLLKVYDIESIDSLDTYIESNHIENILSLNRIVNCWVRNNFDDLKISNNYLEKICKKLLEKYAGTKKYNLMIKNINIDKEVKDYIDYWIEKRNVTDFNLNLLDDMVNHFNDLLNK